MVTAAALTAMVSLVPVMLSSALSVSGDSLVACGVSVALNEPVPSFSVESPGSVAAGSVDAKLIVPEYDLSTLPNLSSAVTG